MCSKPALEEDDEVGGLYKMVRARRDEVDRVDDVDDPPSPVPARRLILKLAEIGKQLPAQLVLVRDDERMIRRRTELVDTFEQMLDDPM